MTDKVIGQDAYSNVPFNGVVSLLSGGMDSSTLLFKAVENFGKDNVIALSVNYGQTHKRELEMAAKIAKVAGVVHQVADMTALTWVLQGSGSPLVNPEIEVQDLTYAEMKVLTGTVQTYIPYRNGILLSLATALAYSNAFSEVWYGAHAEDARNFAYPDCTPEFVEAQNLASYYGTGNKVSVKCPFNAMSKGEVVTEGLRLGVPFELTLSCYRGTIPACGLCPTCSERKSAFVEAGVSDPIAYETVNV